MQASLRWRAKQAPSVKKAAAEELGRLLAEAQRECSELRGELAALMEKRSTGMHHVPVASLLQPLGRPELGHSRALHEHSPQFLRPSGTFL